MAMEEFYSLIYLFMEKLLKFNELGVQFNKVGKKIPRACENPKECEKKEITKIQT